ncbi:uncharacterized protein ACOB8E_013421 [Sarcophilus harrisii]
MSNGTSGSLHPAVPVLSFPLPKPCGAWMPGPGTLWVPRPCRQLPVAGLPRPHRGLRMAAGGSIPPPEQRQELPAASRGCCASGLRNGKRGASTPVSAVRAEQHRYCPWVQTSRISPAPPAAPRLKGMSKAFSRP